MSRRKFALLSAMGLWLCIVTSFGFSAGFQNTGANSTAFGCIGYMVSRWEAGLGVDCEHRNWRKPAVYAQPFYERWKFLVSFCRGAGPMYCAHDLLNWSKLPGG